MILLDVDMFSLLVIFRLIGADSSTETFTCIDTHTHIPKCVSCILCMQKLSLQLIDMRPLCGFSV
jgi:hypothetical protein